MRKEKDSLGEVEVPADRLWGAQTQRSLQNFPIGTEKMPLEVIHAFAVVKKASASVNYKLDRLPKDKADAILYSLFLSYLFYSGNGILPVSK